MRKINWDKEFKIDENVTVECGSQRTSYGFRHLAVLRENGSRKAEAKACYYNRTWEAFEYQSVIHKIIRKCYQGERAKIYMEKADVLGRGMVDDFFGSIKAMAAMGEVLGASQEQKTSIKKAVLSSIPGIDFPEGFDSLPAEEKARRIDGALKIL